MRRIWKNYLAFTNLELYRLSETFMEMNRVHGSLMGASDGGRCLDGMEHMRGVRGTEALAEGRFYEAAGYDFFEHHI